MSSVALSVISVAIAAATAVGVYLTNDPNALWGLVTIPIVIYIDRAV